RLPPAREQFERVGQRQPSVAVLGKMSFLLGLLWTCGTQRLRRVRGVKPAPEKMIYQLILCHFRNFWQFNYSYSTGNWTYRWTRLQYFVFYFNILFGKCFTEPLQRSRQIVTKCNLYFGVDALAKFVTQPMIEDRTSAVFGCIVRVTRYYYHVS